MEKLRLLSDKLCKICFPTIGEGGSVMLDFYIRIMLGLFPLFLMEGQEIGGGLFSAKEALCLILTGVTSGIYIYALSTGRAFYRQRIRCGELLLLFAAGLLILRDLLRVFRGEVGEDKEIFLVCLILIYFLLRAYSRGHEYYLRVLLAASLVLDAGFLQYGFSQTVSVIGVESLIGRSGTAVPWLLLPSCVGAILYSLEKRERWQNFYLFAFAAGSLVSLLYGNVVCACVTGIFLLCIPLAFQPTAALVRKNLILCFAFLFTVSNVPLLQYVDAFHLERQYSLEYSVYLDLFLSAAGAVILQYWERIPKDRDPETVVLVRFRRWYESTLAIALAVLGGIMISGNRLDGITDRLGVPVLKSFAAAWRQALGGSRSFFEELLDSYGVAGCVFWLLIMVFFLQQIRKRWKEASAMVRGYLLLSALFLLQTLFWKLSSYSAPVYVILLALAFSEEKRGPDGRENAHASSRPSTPLLIPMLRPLHDLVQSHGDGAQDQNGGDQDGQLKNLAAVNDEVAQSPPGRQEFADDDAHQRQTDVDLHAA